MSIQNKIVERILSNVAGGGQPLIETDAELRTITGEKPRDLAGRYMEFVRHYFNDISNQTACIKNEIIYDAEINIPSMQELFKNVVYAHNPDRLYYFNANHLGSGSLITDKYGQTYQTLIYAPHGEVLFNKFYGDYDEPYKFTGFEREIMSPGWITHITDTFGTMVAFSQVLTNTLFKNLIFRDMLIALTTPFVIQTLMGIGNGMQTAILKHRKGTMPIH